MFKFLTLEPEAFGLDLSDSSLKIAKLKKKGDFLSLASFGKTDILEGIIKRGEIQDEEALIKIIKKSLAEVKGEKLKTNYIIASLPEEETFLEIIQMPKMDTRELKDAVYLAAENYVPLSIEDVYLDFQVVQPFYDHLDHLDVLIAALPKKIVDSYVSCFKKAGLQLQALEIESLAIARALVKNEASPYPLLLIDFGANKTNLIIFSGHSAQFTRSISLSAQDFTKAISQELNIFSKEAEKLKLKFGLEKKYSIKIEDKSSKRETAPGKLFNIALPLLNELNKEIEKSIDYYQTHIFHEHLPPNGRGIKKILTCGGGANLKGLSEFISLSLELPVELGNPWVNILGSAPQEIPALSYEESLSFTIALGLALRAIRETWSTKYD